MILYDFGAVFCSFAVGLAGSFEGSFMVDFSADSTGTFCVFVGSFMAKFEGFLLAVLRAVLQVV